MNLEHEASQNVKDEVPDDSQKSVTAAGMADDDPYGGHVPDDSQKSVTADVAAENDPYDVAPNGSHAAIDDSQVTLTLGQEPPKAAGRPKNIFPPIFADLAKNDPGRKDYFEQNPIPVAFAMAPHKPPREYGRLDECIHPLKNNENEHIRFTIKLPVLKLKENMTREGSRIELTRWWASTETASVKIPKAKSRGKNSIRKGASIVSSASLVGLLGYINTESGARESREEQRQRPQDRYRVASYRTQTNQWAHPAPFPGWVGWAKPIHII